MINLKQLCSKRDARLYFKYEQLGLNQAEIKNLLIRLQYIDHVEYDRYYELKKLPTIEKLKTIIEDKEK